MEPLSIVILAIVVVHVHKRQQQLITKHFRIMHVKIAVLLFRLSLHARWNVQKKHGPTMAQAKKYDA